MRSFAAQSVLDDPRVGCVEGARGPRAFAGETADWLRGAVVESVALTRTPARTVEDDGYSRKLLGA